MKTLLINPNPGTAVYGKMSRDITPKSAPLGILYITAVLEKNNLPVKAIDADARHLNLASLAQLIKDYQPDLIGITSTTPSFRGAVETAEMCRKVSSAKTILGGVHATVCYEDILSDYSFFDFVIRGEGEFTMTQLVKGETVDKISGLSYRRNGKIIHNPPPPRNFNLDDLPFPSRHFIDLNDYSDPLWNLYVKTVVPIITSRGCPFLCTFCASKTTFGTRVSFRSVENVIDEVKSIIDNYGVRGFSFVDDSVTLKRERLLHLCQELEKLKIKWICNTRVDAIDKETLLQMKKSGCVLIQVGVESGDQLILEQIKKNQSIERVRAVFHWAGEIRLDTYATFIIGLPGDTEETITKTIAFAKEINATFPFFFTLTPYPGTEIYEYARDNDLLLIKDWTEMEAPKYEEPAMRHPLFTAGELKKWRDRAYKQVYFNPRYLFTRVLPKMKSRRIASHYFGLGEKFLRNIILSR